MHGQKLPATGSPLDGSSDACGPSSPYYDDVTRAFNKPTILMSKNCSEMIQHRKPVQQLHAFLNGMLASAGMSELNDQLIVCSDRARRQISIERYPPRARPRIMDIQYLCGVAPYSVPASPWTSVTDSDDLVSHLVSLYLTWGYPFYAFFCRETFIKHMRSGQLNSDFCSPFLVNALLANACFYSDYSEAYSLPGDVKSKGAHFLAEAERHLKSHQFESRSDIRVSSLQAMLLLYSMDGPDDFGYSMLHKAIRMAESLGIVNNAKGLRLEKSYISTDMVSSLKRTAWGLFQIDTIVHMNFLRPSQIKEVNLDRIDRDETPAQESWVPYPIQRAPRNAYTSQYFDESCKLSFIARDTSWKVPHALEDVEEFITVCVNGRRNSPPVFELKEKPAPYILVLRMRYHTLVINLYCYDLQNCITSSKASKDACDSARTHKDAMQTALFSAREIATLIEVYRAEYGLVHCHQFAMYAINVSLFCILAQEDFQILDPDFLRLTSAFSVLACRSRVGRHLFHAFKLSVRSRESTGWMLSTDDIPPGIKDLFGPREKADDPDKWDQYAEGLAEVAGEVSFLGELDKDPAIPGLLDMLKWYEVLSIGKETKWRGKD
ncbi:hypothetical protein N7454_003261 [Penicillium verhagenii]|nr:hypothetical protein N7454_003261 [Penicillium verhagenii]